MKTKVSFRRFPDGDIIAIFPEEKEGPWLNSYEHYGQHCGCHPDLLTDLEPALPAEYEALKNELESIGYDLQIEE